MTSNAPSHLYTEGAVNGNGYDSAPCPAAVAVGIFNAYLDCAARAEAFTSHEASTQFGGAHSDLVKIIKYKV